MVCLTCERNEYSYVVAFIYYAYNFSNLFKNQNILLYGSHCIDWSLECGIIQTI